MNRIVRILLPVLLLAATATAQAKGQRAHYCNPWVATALGCDSQCNCFEAQQSGQNHVHPAGTNIIAPPLCTLTFFGDDLIGICPKNSEEQAASSSRPKSGRSLEDGAKYFTDGNNPTHPIAKPAVEWQHIIYTPGDSKILSDLYSYDTCWVIVFRDGSGLSVGASEPLLGGTFFDQITLQPQGDGKINFKEHKFLMFQATEEDRLRDFSLDNVPAFKETALFGSRCGQAANALPEAVKKMFGPHFVGKTEPAAAEQKDNP